MTPQVAGDPAVTDGPSGASLLPCSAFSSDSSRPMREERPRVHPRHKNLGGSKLGGSTVSERVCGEETVR